MSTNYFLLIKRTDVDIALDRENSLVVPPQNSTVFALPANNVAYYAQHGLFEKHLISWSAQYCNSSKDFIDIGAHTGTYSLYLSRFSNHVHAFEPQKMTYYALCGGIALSNIRNITAHNFGLGSEEQIGELVLQIISPDGGGSTIQKTTKPVLATETIHIRTLDSFNLDNIGFIKIDVEDNELYVLKGGRKTLERNNFPPIIFECNDSSHTLKITEFLTQFPYKITNIRGVSNMFLAFRPI